MTRRTLHLRRETLSALTRDDLTAIAGAGDDSLNTCLEIRCWIAISPSVKPTCQESICTCPTG